MADFARPFRITYLSTFGGVELTAHGVQFPDGRCIVAIPHGGFDAAVDFGYLKLQPGAVVEWADGGQP